MKSTPQPLILNLLASDTSPADSYKKSVLRKAGIVLLCLSVASCSTLLLGPDSVSAGFGLGFVGLLALLAARLQAAALPKFTVDKVLRRYQFPQPSPNLNFGDWQPLPPIKGVVIKYFSERVLPQVSEASNWGKWQAEQPQREQSYVLLLSVASSSQGIVVTRGGLDEKPHLRHLAAQLATYLDVEVREFDSSNS